MNTFGLAFTSALVDFIWQGALVALSLLAALRTFGRWSAQVRYNLALVALMALMALPAITTASRLQHVGAAASAHTTAARFSVVAGPAKPIPADVLFRAGNAPPLVLVRFQPWILPVWSLGVLLLSLRLVVGGLEVRALRRHASAADDLLRERVVRVATLLGLHRSVLVATSIHADGPSVIGWLRPVILLPPATLMGLTTTQLDAVLAHELAHIRRHDYLVNVVQLVAETLLFYHPAVWWVSSRLRIERELCCDDEAVRTSGDATAYAKALVTMARIHVPAMAVGSTGGSLTDRVRRLLCAVRPEPGPSPALGALALAVMLVTTVAAQQALSADKSPSFEVASVRRNVGGRFPDGRMGFRITPGSFSAMYVPAHLLIQFAYGLTNEGGRIIGGPSWLESDRFDVQARIPGSDQRDVPIMLQGLLVNRFKLRAHRETRPLPVYELVVARDDRALGAELVRSRVDCAQRSAERCGTTMDNGFLRSRGATMENIANNLSFLARRTVVDKTGLTDRFDFEIQFSPDGFNGDLPSLFTVLQERLGLKLTAATHPLEVLVIDHIEPPTEN